MIRTAHGEVWFDPATEVRALELCKLQCSATRSASQALTKHGLTGNAVRKYVKKNYMAGLGQRYLNDACALAAQQGDKKVLHGGKKAWRQLQSGELTKQEWQLKRNGQLYSRGDRSRKGNPNIRIEGGKLLVNDPAARGLWLSGKLFIPAKFELNLVCYNVRLIYKGAGRFRVVVQWEEPAPQTYPAQGVVGVDANPDGLGVADVAADGNLLGQTFLATPRLPFASRDKREHDIRHAAIDVVERARKQGFAIAIEKLDFGNRSQRRTRKFRRMAHNFVYRRLCESIKARAEKQGVPCVEVESAFTSILGVLKYEKMYSLNRHTAAAFVIGRRGQGRKERADYRVTQTSESGRTRVNLEGRSRSHTLSEKAYSWLCDCFVRPKPAPLTEAIPSAG